MGRLYGQASGGLHIYAATMIDACGDTLGASICSTSRQDNEETMLIEALSAWHASVVLLTVRAIGSHCQIARKAEYYRFQNLSIGWYLPATPRTTCADWSMIRLRVHSWR